MKKNKLNLAIIILIVIFTLSTLGLLYILSLIPLKYFLGITSILSIIDIFLIYKLVKSKKQKTFKTMSILSIVILIAINFYLFSTLNFFNNFGLTEVTNNYSLIALKSSSDELTNYNDSSIGIYNGAEEYQEAIEKLEKEINFQKVVIEDLSSIITNLESKTVDAILIETTVLNLLIELDPSIETSITTIYQFDIIIYIEDNEENKNINSPINIYLSGADNYNNLSLTTRSDVNMLISINPSTNEILVTSFPRDYYIEVDGSATKDKLTHIGVKGINTLTNSVENLLDIEIDYYIKINFNSVIDIINAIGPIEVYSDYNLTISSDNVNYTIKKGMNEMDGHKALAFSRERKSFTGGDRTRIENQFNVLEGTFNAAINPAILIKYSSFLDTLSNSFITNIPNDLITNYIKNQLDNNSSWKITSNSLEGYDSSAIIPNYGTQELYIMEPNEESVQEAIKLLKEVLN